jgi:hypothetical protein
MRNNTTLLQRPPSWRTVAAVLVAAALFGPGTGIASEQASTRWGIEENASEGCVQDVWLQFDGAAGLASHGPRPVCGSTGVRTYPDSLPSGTFSLGWKDTNGERHLYQVPLDAVLRRENVSMTGTVLEVIYSQQTLEVWTRPLASSSAASVDDAHVPAGRQRIFSAGAGLSPRKDPRPGIHRARE